MSLGRVLGAIGAAATGYMKGQQMAQDEAAQNEDRAFQRQQRARMTDQWAREDKLRAATEQAAAPTTVEDAPQAMPIGSRDEPRAPEDTGIRAAGKSFTDRAEAEKAAADYNAPTAQLSRVAAARRGMGDLEGAMTLENQARAAKLGDVQLAGAEQANKLGALQIEEHQRVKVNRAFDDSLKPLASHADLAATVSGSLIGGDRKLTVMTSPEGKKVQYAELLPDGTSRKLEGMEFGADARGLAEAKMALSKNVSITDQINYLHQKDAQVQTAKHQDATLAEQRRGREETTKLGYAKLAADRADAAAGRGIQMRQLKLAEQAAQPQPATAASTFDRKTISETAASIAQAEAKAAAEAGTPWSNAKVAQRVDGIIQEQFKAHSARFDAQVSAQILDRAKADPAVYAAEYAKALSKGRTAEGLAAQGFKPPPGAAPAAAQPAPAGQPAAPAPRAAMGQAAPAGQAPAAPIPFEQFVAQNIATPGGKQEISRRIQAEMPELQRAINGDSEVLAMPSVTGAVKARIKQRMDANAQTMQMMQLFLQGNPGI